MRGGEQRVDVHGLEGIDRPLLDTGIALQYVQQLPEPTSGSHLPNQGGIRPHPLGLVHDRLVLLGQLRGNGDGVKRVDDDSTQAVFRKVRHERLLSFGNDIRLYNQLYRYSLITREKGKPNADPTLCENDNS